MNGAAAGTEQGLLVECVYLLECIAPAKLHADRFLPVTPIRVLVDHRRRDRTADHPIDTLAPLLVKGDPRWIREKSAALKNVVNPLIKRAEALAEEQAGTLRAEAEEAMSNLLGEEFSRLKALEKLGHPIREEELAGSEAERDALTQSLGDARVRLDAVRLILLQP